MRKSLLIIFLIISQAGISQTADNRPIQNIEGLKIAYITKQLSLSSIEAQKFWPVYFSYDSEIKATRKENNGDIISLDEKILAVRKKYIVQFKNILGTDVRANSVFTSERDFGNYIRKEIEARQRMKGLRQPPQNQQPN